MAVEPIRALQLYSRSYCHLCEEMARALEPLQREFGFSMQVIDVDSDPSLEARYGEWVPVLTAGTEQLCHYFLDAARVRAYFAHAGESPSEHTPR
jgi:thiol-disulfide isomerase/thioredoxin